MSTYTDQIKFLKETQTKNEVYNKESDKYKRVINELTIQKYELLEQIRVLAYTTNFDVDDTDILFQKIAKLDKIIGTLHNGVSYPYLGNSGAQVSMISPSLPTYNKY